MNRLDDYWGGWGGNNEIGCIVYKRFALQRLQRTTLHSLTNYNAIGSKITDRWLQCVQYELLLLGALAGWK